MRAKQQNWWTAATTLGIAVLLTGCCCPGGKPATSAKGACFTACKENIRKEIPIITCQPVDTFAKLNTKTELYCEGTGSKLSYEWFFLDVATQEYVTKPGWDKPVLVIDPVSNADYGWYYCVIKSATDENGITITRSRDAGLGPAPGGTGGPFTTMQWSSSADGVGGTLCSPPVQISKKWVYFPMSQTPDANGTFRGSLWKVGATTPYIPGTDYVLQWWVNSSSNGCCTPATPPPNNEVTCPVTAGVYYYFVAHFKPLKGPPNGTQVELRGGW